ncbi:type VI secretion system-associated FHA domain protein TagH [Massilia arenosa]|uniref:Type VI secretion system-associated FHA domain protein TagH n=2 Tax=Zemynaea arenosa TaxID=2561931 RepID=A0A4Y9S3B0_9BURK|nr:type VI secretion system-associated FHA domain protein TagH [Massilia arenosa]
MQMTTLSAAPSPSATPDDLMAAFLRGAGLEGVAINWQMTPEFMELAGRLLATSVDGACNLLAARSQLKRDVNADKTMVVVRNNNPLKFLPDGQTALTQMLRKKMPGFMGPEEALADAFADLATHQQCVVAGMQGAVAAAVERLAPEPLEDSAPRGGLLNVLVPARRKAALWERYCALHAETRAEVTQHFETALGAAFTAAYERALDAQ